MKALSQSCCFLGKATEHVSKAVYEDRYLMPTEIRKAVSDCSNDMVGEIRDEIKALRPIFDKLEHSSEEKRFYRFRRIRLIFLRQKKRS